MYFPHSALVNGRGVKQSWEEALKYFGTACDLKEQMGCDHYKKAKERVSASPKSSSGLPLR
ncbi:MAG: hypothetical protein LBI87_13130 [Candidatus Accumulibacter sp.]|jgi:TPR repeat protein|nr:hypothetical protein [Accumulibacter sp.]